MENQKEKMGLYTLVIIAQYYKMEPYICKREGIEINMHDMEDVCPDCKSEVISVNDIEKSDWISILDDLMERLPDDIDTDDWLSISETINDMLRKHHIDVEENPD